jgi:hypothetical protein
MTLSQEDIVALQSAKHVLDNPGLATKITNALGVPIGEGFSHLPASWQRNVSDVTNRALEVALNVAIETIDFGPGKHSHDIFHKVVVVATGASAGAFGLAALAVELPVSTTVMLRSIADIARSHGEDLNDVKARLACLEVFALGGNSGEDDTPKGGYYGMRGLLAKAVSEAAEFIAERGIVKEGAPPLIRFIILVAERFGIQVSEKVATQAVPVIGAAGGAIINYIFIHHFQDIARGHFTVRSLERKYGSEVVENAYLMLDK